MTRQIPLEFSGGPCFEVSIRETGVKTAGSEPLSSGRRRAQGQAASGAAKPGRLRRQAAPYTGLRWRARDPFSKSQARYGQAIHPGGMKEGSRGSKPGETPGTTAWMACTPEGCQRGSPVFWQPSGVLRDNPAPTDRGSQLRCDPRLPSGNPPGCEKRPRPAWYRSGRRLGSNHLGPPKIRVRSSRQADTPEHFEPTYERMCAHR